MIGSPYVYIDTIRDEFAELLKDGIFVEDKSGVKVLEIPGVSFVTDADEPIFGTWNKDYIQRELAWYKTQSLNVNDIPGGAPEIWKQVADSRGFINSNYGWAIWSPDNSAQYFKVLKELSKNPLSRRAIMIYTRPSMWYDYDLNGRSDFMCTNSVQYLIRNGKISAVVQMRSNDVFSGYRNDYAWQRFVLDELAIALDVPSGDIIWQVGSLHVYEPQFYLVHHYLITREISITKKKYAKTYPISEWKPTDA